MKAVSDSHKTKGDFYVTTVAPVNQRREVRFRAADAVLIPLHCEYFALEGLADLVGTMQRVQAALNSALEIEGVLLTMYDERTNLGHQVAKDVREFFKEKVYRTVIPRNVRLGEAPSHGLPVMLYDIKSRGAEAYLALAREVLERSAQSAA
jgi:chromosome partitioning protein